MPRQSVAPALALAEPHEILVGSLLQFVQVPVDGSPSFCCVNHTAKLHVIYKTDEGALDQSFL